MKFIIDENVPTKLVRILRGLGHDATRVVPTTPDPENARLARREGRTLITIDHDFTNRSQYPPKEFDILLIHIHPPEKEEVVKAVQTFLATDPKPLKGLVILGPGGLVIRIPE